MRTYNQRGRGNKAPSPGEGALAAKTLAAYRKVHAHKARLDDYPSRYKITNEDRDERDRKRASRPFEVSVRRAIRSLAKRGAVSVGSSRARFGLWQKQCLRLANSPGKRLTN